MTTTTAKVRQRIIKLISFFDDIVWQHADRGKAKDGNDTTSRGQLKDMLRKKVELNGNKVPVYFLAEEPDSLYKNDPLDEEFFKNRGTGEWLKPSREWLEAREKNAKQRFERIASNRRRQEELASRKLMKGLAKLAVDNGGDDDGARRRPPAPKRVAGDGKPPEGEPPDGKG